jgi:amino acid permease
MSIFKSTNGQYSSKRVMGILYLVLLIVLFIYKETRDSIIANPEIFIGMVGTGGGLLGLGLIEYFSKFNSDKKKSNTDLEQNN